MTMKFLIFMTQLFGFRYMVLLLRSMKVFEPYF
jgi:hypothetical protein